QASRGREDGRERRAQLMGDRVKQLRLEVVGATQHLRFGRLLAKARALDSQAQLGGRDREQSFIRRPELGDVSPRKHPKRSDSFGARHDRNDARPLLTRGSWLLGSYEAYAPRRATSVEQA